MQLELCRVTTEDGLQLDGTYAAPASPGANPKLDALLLVHGTGSNFYAPGVLEEFARQAVASGVAVLRINTRGHDGVCSIPTTKGSVKGGAAYEVLGDCRLDLSAWVAFLEQRGHRRIGLVGHSSGGVKVLYTLAHLQLPSVVAAVAISPPRFRHEQLRQHADFRHEFEKAEALVDASQGDSLQQMTQPLPLLIAAACIVKKYPATDTYDFVRHLGQVRVLTLILLGSKTVETSIAFQGLPDAIHELKLPHVELQTIDGANIHYTGCATAPWERTSEWLKSLH